MGQARVLLIDDHHLFRAALKLLLSSAPMPLSITAEACTASEAYPLFDRDNFDVIVLDLVLPGSSGLTILHEAKRRKLRQPRLVLSAHNQIDMITEAIAAGASGYVSKDQDPAELFEALRTVLRGETYLPPSVPREALAGATRRTEMGRAGSPRALLSPREREVFELLLQGYSNSAVAGELFISHKTVETHRGHILKKLGVHSICELMALASRHNLLSHGDAAQQTSPDAEELEEVG